MKFKNLKNLDAGKIFLALLLAFSAQAHAAYNCTGPVGGVSLDASGTLLAATIAGITWPKICDVNTTQNGFEPNVCKTVYTQLITAQTTGKTVTIYFNDAGSCSSHPAWQWASGLYFLTLN